MIETPEQFRRRAGRIEIGRSPELADHGAVIGQFVVALLLVSVIVGVAAWLLWPWLLPVFIGVPAFAAYCALSYFVRPRPNHDELTRRFGEISLSHEVNNYLILLVIVLAPGRFISVGIVDGVRLFASRRNQS